MRYKPKKVLDFSWSPNLAYVVGLLVTDGCLLRNKKTVTFTSKDIEQIGNVKLILNLPGKVGFTRNTLSETYRIQFSNVQLWDWLESIGLTPHKSLTIGPIKIPDNFFIDFLRGHLDGDGSITKYIDRYNTRKNPAYIYDRICVRFISASNAHIDWLKDRIFTLLQIRGSLHEVKNDHKQRNSMYVIKFGKKESLKLLACLYYDDLIPNLTRKKSIYIDFLTHV